MKRAFSTTCSDFIWRWQWRRAQAVVGIEDQEIDPRTTSRFSLGVPTAEQQQITGRIEHNTGESTAVLSDEVFVRVGRYGPFIEQGERKAGIPDMLPPDEITMTKALELLEGAAKGDEPLGHCPETGKPIYIKVGRFGPYVQFGDADDEDKKNAGCSKGWPSKMLTRRRPQTIATAT
jgi:DNA topoisomerase I